MYKTFVLINGTYQLFDQADTLEGLGDEPLLYRFAAWFIEHDGEVVQKKE